MKRTLLISIILISGVAVCYFIWTAISARKRSDELLSKFNEIESQLKSTNDTLTKENIVEVYGNSFSIASMNTQIILLIDSLKQQYEDMPTTTQSFTASKRQESDIKRLLTYMQEVNRYKWDMADSRIPDTIRYWTASEVFHQQKWFSTYFVKQPKESSITYLNYLKNEAIANNH